MELFHEVYDSRLPSLSIRLYAMASGEVNKRDSTSRCDNDSGTNSQSLRPGRQATVPHDPKHTSIVQSKTRITQAKAHKV